MIKVFSFLTRLLPLFVALGGISGRLLAAEFITPESTFSPDGRYGITLLVFHEGDEPGKDARKNQVIERKTGGVVAILDASPGYDLPLNHRETAPPLWSDDSSVLLWQVDGKWFPDALVLLKLKDGKEQWQLDLMKSAQRAILERTQKAAPQKYAAAKKANAGSGSAFPEGFTITVNPVAEKLAFPFRLRVDLTANPKGIEDFPANLDSHLDATVTADGKFEVSNFKLGLRPE